MISRPSIRFHAALAFCGAMLISSAALAAQPARPSARDTAQLRRDLQAAIGADFRIVRHEVSPGTPERGGPFWLVHVAPRRSGNWHLQYRYRYVDRARPQNPLYTHVTHDSYIRVGRQGCHRGREAKDACVGDTVILPFVLNEFTGHTFTLEYRGPDSGQELSSYDGADAGVVADSAVENPASRVLRYLGTRRDVRLHRSPGSTTVYSAVFEAVAPGRLNLAVAPRIAGTNPDELPRVTSVPVIVVPRGRPVTALLRGEEVTARDEVHNFSSHSGNAYPTTLLLLQPGERITLEFHRVTLRGRDQPRAGEGARDVAPAIARLPFHLDPDERFNAWIAAHLPRADVDR